MLGKRFQRTTSMAQIGPAWSIQPEAAAAPVPPQPVSQWEILKQAEEMMMKMMAAAGAAAAAATGTTALTGGRAAGDMPADSSAAAGICRAAGDTPADSGRAARPPISGLPPRGTFLDNCFFCKRRLKHERDIFIYRGDAAFCTEECRQRHILNDERSMTASKKGSSASAVAA